MEISIEIHNNPTNEQKDIITKYWAYENYDFVNKPTPLSKEYDLTMHELITLIKKHSICQLNVGQCKECGVEIVYEVFSQYKFNLAEGNYNIFCETHREEFFDEVKKTGKKIFEMKMRYAIACEVWKNLDTLEYEFFIKLISTANKDQICFNYLRNDPYEKGVNWIHIRKFEKLGLLKVCRNKKDNMLIDRFIFPPELTTKFVGIRLDSILQKDTYKNELQVKLKQNRKKKLPSQSDYYVMRRFDNSMLIEQGKEFLISAWVGELDKTISISLIPSNKINGVNDAKDSSFKPAFVKYAELKDPKKTFDNFNDELEDFDDAPF